MRDMNQEYGMILIEPTSIVLRIYCIATDEWKLLHFKSVTLLPQTDEALIEALAGLIISQQAQYVKEWKMCARNMSQKTLRLVSSKLAVNIESLTHVREQELLCKGMFTELW